MDIKLSVIVPVYNTEKLLTRCLNSLRNQTDSAFEFILVDDGSTDGSLEVCKQFAEEDPRFVVIHQENAGSVSARNTGIDRARGAYLAFADSDDYLDPEYFTAVFEESEKYGADIVATSFLEERDHIATCLEMSVGSGFYSGTGKNKILSQLLAVNMDGERGISSALWSKIYKASIVKQCCHKVDPQLRMAEDLILMLHCCLTADSILVVNQMDAHYHYVIHPDQLTQRFDPCYEQRLPILYGSVLQIHRKYGIPDFERQFDHFVLRHTTMGFENLFYAENELTAQEKKKRVKYLCAMARYYRPSGARRWDSKTGQIKRAMIRLANFSLISYAYKRMKKIHEK